MKRRTQEKKTSSPSRKRQHRNEIKNSDGFHVPMDLTVDILSRLPAKSTVRFKCVSKLWSSLITTDSIMTWSLAKPCLLVVSKQPLLEFSVFSLSGNLFSTNNESIFTEQDSNTLDRGFVINNMYQYIRGLICCLSSYSYGQFMIYNPTTRESLLLPKIKWEKPLCTMDRLFGYDPVEKQYKVLCFISSVTRKLLSCQIFTLGDPKKQWRKIRGFERFTCPDMLYARVCINGKIYFLGSNILMSFDIRSERLFDHGEVPYNQSWNKTLVNYQGKLACMGCSKHSAEVWVMEDKAEKQKWSKITFFMHYLLLEDLVSRNTRIACVTLNGEVVIMPSRISVAGKRKNSLYALFYDPKKYKTRRVEFESTLNEILENQEQVRIFCVPDHVENPMSLSDSFH